MYESPSWARKPPRRTAAPQPRIAEQRKRLASEDHRNPTHSREQLNAFDVIEESGHSDLVVPKSKFDGDKRDERESRRKKEVFRPKLGGFCFGRASIRTWSTHSGREIIRIDSLLGDERRFPRRKRRLEERRVYWERIGSIWTREDSVGYRKDRRGIFE